jgi:hypothetical protein
MRFVPPGTTALASVRLPHATPSWTRTACESAARCAMVPAWALSFVRRQQLRRVRRASRRVGASLAALGVALLLARAGAWPAAGLAALTGIGLLLAGRRQWRLAARSRVGARSEAQVHRVLSALARDGWQVRHAVDWPGRGDLDHVASAPSGIGFVIETKTLRYTRAHVGRTVQAARWLGRRRHRYPRGVVPVVCITRARWVERFEYGALVVSLDRLVPALYAAAIAPPATAGASGASSS